MDPTQAEEVAALVDEQLEPEASANARQLYATYVDTSSDVLGRIWDEAIANDGLPRPGYTKALQHFAELGTEELGRRMQQMADAAEEAGVYIRVTGTDTHQPFPVDFVPRIIEAEQWAELSRGIEQRARALNAFLVDIYGEQRIVAAGILDAEDLAHVPGYDYETGSAATTDVRAHISGVDLVCDHTGRWVVLEDNLRVPSGAAFSVAQRRMMEKVFPELVAQHELEDPGEIYEMLRETFLAAGAAEAPEQPAIGVLSIGPHDSVYFEHELIARKIGAPILTPDKLAVVNGYLHYRDGDDSGRLDVVYARIGQDELFEATGYDGQVLGPGVRDALRGGRLALANAFGNGVADDKSIYPYVPQMIEFYLEETPLIDQVPTLRCSDPQTCQYVIAHVDELVVKPVDGYGGAGITIGPLASPEELEARRAELRENPELFVAQGVVNISTLPTFDAESMQQRHVDLRAMVHLRSVDGDVQAVAVPACLTRTAPARSLVVNSSRGGGGKDTWILRAGGRGR